MDAEQLRQHDKMYRDLYEGSGIGNPSITTRLSVAEDKLERILDSIKGLKWWAMGIIGSALGEALVHIFKH